jgi:hypothetical protein
MAYTAESPSVVIFAYQDDPFERFGVGDAGLSAALGGPLAQHVGGVPVVRELAGVLAQRFDLEVERAADVYPGVGLRAGSDPHLLHRVWLQPFFAQFGEDERHPGCRSDGVERGLGHGAVVGVVDVPIAEDKGRVEADDSVRLEAADLAHQVPAQRQTRLDLVVVVAQEDDLVHADSLCGGLLLGFTDARQFLARHPRLVAASIAAGDQHVAHRAASLRPPGRAASHDELDVVGVGGDEQRPLWGWGFWVCLRHGRDCITARSRVNSRVVDISPAPLYNNSGLEGYF